MNDSSNGAGSSYLVSVRAHKLLVAAVAIVTLLAAGAWLQLRTPNYEATAQMLIAPLPQDDTTFIGLPMLRDSGDPTRTAQTAATLAETPVASKLTAEKLGGQWTEKKVSEAVTLAPEGQSNILDITAATENANESAKVADTYVEAVTEARDDILHEQVEKEIASSEARLETAEPGSPTTTALSGKISRLTGLLETGDPTLQPSATATVPTSASGAGATIVLPLALIAGLILGGLAATGLDLLNRRIRDEEELMRVWALPILARVPLLRRLARKATGSQLLVEPQSREAFRTIIAQLETSLQDSHSLMLTSASTGDGKTTATISLGMSLAAMGNSVVLLDLDLRKPDLSRRLDIHPIARTPELLQRLDEKGGIGDLLVPVEPLKGLRVLSVIPNEEDATSLGALNHRFGELLEAARREADYVVVDTAPLGEVSDALRIAQLVDSVIFVARLGSTRRRNLEVSRDLLERAGRPPAGYLVLGGDQGATGYY